MTKQPVIAITGAQGFIGKRIAEHFADKGWQVRALVRRVPEKTDNPRISYHAYDLTTDVGGAILKGVDYLVHAAYIKHTPSQPNAAELNKTGTKKLLAAARKQRVRRTIFISSLSAKSDAVSQYGQQKFAIEKLFDTQADTVVRPGLVVGSGGLVKEMVAFMRTKHIVPLIDGGNQPVQIIGIGELVNAIDTILTKDITGTLTLASDKTYAYKNFYKAISERIGAKVLFVPLSFGVMFGLVRFASKVHIPLAISEDNLLGLKRMKHVKTAADLKKVGITIPPLEKLLKKIEL